MITWAQSLLIDSDSALLDAQVLLAYALDKETIYLMTWPEREISKEQQSKFEGLIEKRCSGVPVAHLVGIREFWSLPIRVNDSTLIPRPDSEILVESALDICEANANILDLGTGTGAIILALANERPNANCVGIDFSQKAVDLAIDNATQLAISNVLFKQSDWFENVTGKFDVIVSNPPYIDKNDAHLKQGDVRFEPLSALVAGNKGLADIQIIAKQAKKYLEAGGYLLIEHGFDQGESVRLILQSNGYSAVRTIKDYGDNDRICIGAYNEQVE